MSFEKRLFINTRIDSMTINEFSNLAEGIKAIAVVITLIIGGFCIYIHYYRNSIATKKSDFDIDIQFRVCQDHVWIVELIVSATNTGIKSLRYQLRHINDTDPVIAKNRFDAFIPHPTTEGTFVPGDWSSTLIKDETLQKYSVLCRVPTSASGVLVQCRVFFEEGDWRSIQKFIHVPPSKTT